MRVLIVKTSSMGDVIHALPALTDAGNVFPDIRFDWVVEENFAEIPAWHPLVNQVIPVALRRWRKNVFAATTRTEWKACYKKLRETQYDFIIDAQGLLKSAWLVWMARGVRCGFDWASAREPLASIFYTGKYHSGKVKAVHAVTRVRRLMSGALGYEMPDTIAHYGIDRTTFLSNPPTLDKIANLNSVLPVTERPYVVFLHGTTWDTKHWPEDYWIALGKKLSQQNVPVKLSWGNQVEEARAQRIAAACDNVEVLPRMKLVEFAGVLAGAKAIVAVDTGLGHLAAALDVPTISLYGPTNPVLTGAMGQSQTHLSVNYTCSPCLSQTCLLREDQTSPLNPTKPPCFSTLSPDVVWGSLVGLL